MADPINISERTHPLYDLNIDAWLLYYNSAKGGENFITDANLFSHRLEESDDYDERLDRAYFLNFCDTIPNIYNSYIFKSKIERAPDAILDRFRGDVDGKGTDISDYIKRVGYLASVYGVVHVFVDMPSIIAEKARKRSLTRAETKNTLPYLSIIHPTRLKDWSIDEFGNYKWVVIEDTYYEDDDPTVEREEKTIYKLITREDWRIEDTDGNLIKFADGSPAEGQNKLGDIQIVTMYHKDLSNNKIGESLLKDIVYVNRIIMNWCSCIDEMIERQTFSQLVVPDDGALSDEEETGDPLNKIGTSSVWTYPAESRTPPAFISPDTQNITTIWKLVSDHVKEIYRMSGLIGGTSDLYVSRSGRQSQMSFLGTNSSLAEKAATYQKFENQVSRLVYKLLGQDSSKYNDVTYPNQFDITSLADEINEYFKMMEYNFSPKFNKVLQKNMVRKAIPTTPYAIRKEIEAEIDASTGIIEKKSTTEAEVAPLDDESGNPNSNAGDTNRTADELEDEEINKKAKEN